jgi:hypothetical protein
MSKTQWPHTLYFSLNQEKQDSPVLQTGVSGFACNDYISNYKCFDSKTGYSDFY